VATIRDLLDVARESEVRLIACQMTMDVFGYRREDFIEGVEFGGAAAFLATDRGAIADFPAWAEDRGHELIECHEEGGPLVFHVRKQEDQDLQVGQLRVRVLFTPGHTPEHFSYLIYYEKHYNLAMRAPDAATFAAFVRDTARPFPVNYARIKSDNLGLVTTPTGEAATV
jgi:hypothetical protein